MTVRVNEGIQTDRVLDAKRAAGDTAETFHCRAAAKRLSDILTDGPDIGPLGTFDYKGHLLDIAVCRKID